MPGPWMQLVLHWLSIFMHLGIPISFVDVTINSLHIKGVGATVAWGITPWMDVMAEVGTRDEVNWWTRFLVTDSLGGGGEGTAQLSCA